MVFYNPQICKLQMTTSHKLECQSLRSVYFIHLQKWAVLTQAWIIFGHFVSYESWAHKLSIHIHFFPKKYKFVIRQPIQKVFQFQCWDTLCITSPFFAYILLVQVPFSRRSMFLLTVQSYPSSRPTSYKCFLHFPCFLPVLMVTACMSTLPSSWLILFCNLILFVPLRLSCF